MGESNKEAETCESFTNYSLKFMADYIRMVSEVLEVVR